MTHRVHLCRQWFIEWNSCVLQSTVWTTG